MKHPPTISVIIPTYNRRDTLGRAVQSVLTQTYRDLELIIVDDGSTDDTKTLITGIQDDRVRFIQTAHRGGAAARNVGVQHARASYIAFQDSDDEWYPQKLEKQIHFFTSASPSIGVVYCGLWKRTRAGKNVYLPRDDIYTKEGNVHHQLLEENFITTQSAVVRSECFIKIGMFDENLPGLQEWDLWLRISQKYEFGYIPEALLQTHFTKDSITAQHRLRLRAQEIILNKYLDEFKKYPNTLSRHSFSIGNTLAIRGDFRHARPYLRQASLASPRKIKYWAAWLLSLFGSKKIYRTLGKYGTYIV